MEYGLDYAMNRHDIERLESVEIQDSNEKIALGWKPLHMTSHQHGTSVIMGVPRPKYCTEVFNKPHKVQQVWDNKNGVWECPECNS